ncbi:MAG TPA: PH domain-containing protein [Candidatus Limnocylindrales bacterium]|nr:PH domain-containing protein [Candidatus Limnocylindrales bacterium]
MPYTDTLLANGERIVRRAHQHWFVLVWNARWAIAALLAALALVVLRSASNAAGPVMDILGFVTLGLAVGGLIWIGWSYLRYLNEEYTVTNRRLIHAEGVINKRSMDSSLEKINDAELTQSVFGRIFGFGDLDVLTASETGIDRLRMLRDANGFKKAMLEAKHDLELEYNRPTSPPLRAPAGPAGIAGDATGWSPPPPTASADRPGTEAAARAAMTAAEVTAALERLADLRDRGAITAAEYDAKKAELLARL